MQTRQLDIADDAIARLCALKRVAHARDHPDRPPDCAVALRGDLRHPRPGTLVHHRMVHDDDVAVAYLRVTMSIQDNLHLAMGDVLVHPEHLEDMVAINDLLGYEVVDATCEYQCAL